jgi:hypothetical protein
LKTRYIEYGTALMEKALSRGFFKSYSGRIEGAKFRVGHYESANGSIEGAKL